MGRAHYFQKHVFLRNQSVESFATVLTQLFSAFRSRLLACRQSGTSYYVAVWGLCYNVVC